MSDQALDTAGRLPDEVVAPRKLSTFEIVGQLWRLAEYLVDLESEENPDQEAIEATKLELQRYASIDLPNKIDGVGSFVRKLEAQVEHLRNEEKVYNAQRKAFEKLIEKMRGICDYAVRAAGPIKGNITSIRIDPDKEQLEIEDEAKIPDQYKIAVVEMPYMLWKAVCDSLPGDVLVDLAANSGGDQVLIDEGAVKTALLNKIIVPGARLQRGDGHLVMTHAGKNVRRAKKDAAGI